MFSVQPSRAPLTSYSFSSFLAALITIISSEKQKTTPRKSRTTKNTQGQRHVSTGSRRKTCKKLALNAKTRVPANFRQPPFYKYLRTTRSPPLPRPAHVVVIDEWLKIPLISVHVFSHRQPIPKFA